MKQFRAILLNACLLFTFLLNACQKELFCEWCIKNQPPVALAGADQTIVLPKDSIWLSGDASTDPDGTIVFYSWQKIAGPGSIIMLHSNDSNTLVRSLTEAVYTFELTVTDNGGLKAKDTVQVFVRGSDTRLPPVACAGADQEITIPVNTALLDGACSTDPNNNISLFKWTGIAGPSPANIVSGNTAQTQVNNLVPGIYQFELQVTDSTGLVSRDTLQVKVVAAIIECNFNTLPLVNTQVAAIGNFSQPRTRMAVAAVGNKILYAGGLTNTGTVSSRVDIFDISTNVWTTASLSVGRYYIGSATLGNKVFFAGGESGFNFTGIVSKVDIYDASTDTWSATDLSRPGHSIAVTTVGNKVLFAGGMNFNNGRESRVDIYDMSIDEWYTASLSTARSEGHSAVTVGSKVYIAGRHNPSLTNVIDIYDDATRAWSVSNLLEEKSNMGTVAMGNKIYWGGGGIQGQSTCHLEVRDINTGVHTLGTIGFETKYDMSTGHNPVVLNGKIIFPFRDYFHMYDTQTNTWSRGNFPTPGFVYTSFISVNNALYVSGSLPGDNLATVWKMSF
jgi:hypothetical protein